MRWFGCLLGCSVSLLMAARAGGVSASVYAELPSAAGARLSPDGNSIAYIDGSGDSLSVVIARVDGGADVRVPAGGWNPKWVEWKDDQTLLAGMRQTAEADGGVPYPVTELEVISADGSRVAPVRYQPPAEMGAFVIGGGHAAINIGDRVVSDLASVRGRILVEVGDVVYDYPSVYDTDVWDSVKHAVVHARPGVTGWVADPAGAVRAAFAQSETAVTGVYDYQILARVGAGGGWRVLPYQADDLAFSADDPRVLYALLAPEDGPSSVVQFDIPTGKITKIWATAPSGRLWLIVNNGAMEGFGESTSQGKRETYVDPAWADDAAAIGRALGVSSVELVDYSADGKRLTALAGKTSGPENLWLLDRRQTPSALIPLISDYSDVPAAQVAVGRWESFTARDGVEVPVLVTVPKGVSAPVPFVVLPHGGPSEYDSGDFNWLAQFLVSRGYGVLQPEFRGSTGFSADLQRLGKREWGRTMQDDVTDATRWLVAQGMAPPGKICIVGASYGGYAALEGAVREPGLYACAAAVAAVTDLPEFLSDERLFAFSDENIPEIGGDRGALAAVSPDRHADQVRAPVLLIAGDQDYTVSVRQTQMMEAALKAAGKQEQTIYLQGSDHYLGRPGDRLAVLDALAGFLARNLGGG